VSLFKFFDGNQTNVERVPEATSLCTRQGQPWEMHPDALLDILRCAISRLTERAAIGTGRGRFGWIDLPASRSLRPWLCLHLRQHAAHERQQLVQGVELGYLVGG
jgi:hypothetical protein